MFRFIIFVFFFIFFLFPQSVFAEMTPYRSAGWVGTQTWLANYYQNLIGCQATDGAYCERPSAPGGMNLYFSSFGNLADFGIPHGSTIHRIHIRVIGKNNVMQWIQVGQGRDSPVGSLCQNPNLFDMWQVHLGVTDSIRELHTTFTPFSTGGNNLGQCFSANNINAQNFTLTLFFNGYNIDQWYAYIDNFEIAFDYTPPATPTLTPTNTPTPTMNLTPTPTAIPAPEPFLELPWDYENIRNHSERRKLTFEEASLAINSYFDHEYPFLSSGFAEPNNSITNTIMFGNRDAEEGYSSHDGYDWGTLAQVEDGDPIFAAASGKAILVTEEHSGGGGNVIKITHDNGYQTWYEHLYYDEYLIVKNENEEIDVIQGQRIGSVGHTGNCYIVVHNGNRIYNTPACAHIHFAVFQDKDEDGDFSDNVPDGVIDPFGWQSEEPDPWEHYSFFYDGQQRTGNKSYYLWTKKLPGLKEGLPSNGGIFNFGKTTVTFPDDPTRPFLNLDMKYSPYANASASLVGLAPTLDIVAKNLLGDIVKVFPEYITIKIDFSDMDLSRFDLGTTTFSIYSSDDQGNWLKEPTVIDLTNKTATTQVNHLTYFALMAERIDTTAPVTIAEVQGTKGQDNWYRSDVSVSLTSEDNDGGFGVDYTFYKIEGDEWQQYTTPLVFTTEGEHMVSFYSVDNDDNIEELKTVTFVVDRTPPEAEIYYNLENFDIEVVGKDGSESANVTIQSSFLHPNFIVSDKAGNTLFINTDKIKLGKQVLFLINSLQYNTNPQIDLDKQIFFTFVIPSRNDTIKKIDQYYTVKGDKNVFIRYVAAIEMTTIYTKTSGVSGYTREDMTGIFLLKLSTQNGTLKYSY